MALSAEARQQVRAIAWTKLRDLGDWLSQARDPPPGQPIGCGMQRRPVPLSRPS